MVDAPRGCDSRDMHRLTTATIDTEAALRELLGEPSPLVCAKVRDRLDPLTRQFIERAPFVCLATADAAGNCDVSPRGGAPGFVQILDEQTLLVPDRPGNRLADSLRNILGNPHVGMLFVIPGVTDTFRVNGRATITNDAALLAPCTAEGKPPLLGLIIDIESRVHPVRQGVPPVAAVGPGALRRSRELAIRWRHLPRAGGRGRCRGLRGRARRALRPPRGVLAAVI